MFDQLTGCWQVYSPEPLGGMRFARSGPTGAVGASQAENGSLA